MKHLKTIRTTLGNRKEMDDFFLRFKTTKTLSHAFESVLRRNNVDLNCETFKCAKESAIRRKAPAVVLEFIEAAEAREEALAKHSLQVSTDGWFIDL